MRLHALERLKSKKVQYLLENKQRPGAKQHPAGTNRRVVDDHFIDGVKGTECPRAICQAASRSVPATIHLLRPYRRHRAGRDGRRARSNAMQCSSS